MTATGGSGSVAPLCFDRAKAAASRARGSEESLSGGMPSATRRSWRCRAAASRRFLATMKLSLHPNGRTVMAMQTKVQVCDPRQVDIVKGTDHGSAHTCLHRHNAVAISVTAARTYNGPAALYLQKVSAAPAASNAVSTSNALSASPRGLRNRA